MVEFDKAKMTSLYGDRLGYLDRFARRLDELASRNGSSAKDAAALRSYEEARTRGS